MPKKSFFVESKTVFPGFSIDLHRLEILTEVNKVAKRTVTNIRIFGLTVHMYIQTLLKVNCYGDNFF